MDDQQNQQQTSYSPDQEAAFDQQFQDQSRRDSDRNQERLVLEWVAPSRPYKQRDREFYTTIGIIVFLVSLILFFAGQFLFIAVIVSVAFVAYVINTVPPEKITNRITTFGIHTGNAQFYWEELGRFWFTQTYGLTILNIETSRAFPGVVTLLLEGVTEEQVKKEMLEYTVFEKPKATWVDTSAKWLQEKFPLEKK